MLPGHLGACGPNVSVVIAIMMIGVLATAVMRPCKFSVYLVCGVVWTIVDVSMIAVCSRLVDVIGTASACVDLVHHGWFMTSVVVKVGVYALTIACSDVITCVVTELTDVDVRIMTDHF